ncbi:MULTISPECIES: reductase [Lactobacillus]|uniref:Reductase n=1 Tax=Lactobacillus xujianguonis TaxID=2495899 RepID=A0A437SYF2_9LACO|nr:MULTISPECIES: reductase [Lactobacillus]RVU71837.1 reductase [Lactobacillus xujianguonis]RVU77613.1 reductase [Lactobacillus xujianguonis]
MLIQYKKDYEKTAMGLLSYLPDFKNLANLKDEMHLNQEDNSFQLYLFRDSDANIIGVIGTQKENHFIIIRYLSLAPGYREKKYQRQILEELIQNNPQYKISAVPEYTYILKLLKR